jgi:hypothetical protein
MERRTIVAETYVYKRIPNSVAQNNAQTDTLPKNKRYIKARTVGAQRNDGELPKTKENEDNGKTFLTVTIPHCLHISSSNIREATRQLL